MKPKIITAFEAQDGSLFKSELEAVAHDAASRWTEFYKTIAPETITASESDIKQIVELWEAFKVNERLGDIKNMPIASLDMTVRTTNCLKSEGIKTLAQLMTWSEDSLLKTPNLGRRSLVEILEKLTSMGLSLNNVSPTNDHQSA